MLPKEEDILRPGHTSLKKTNKVPLRNPDTTQKHANFRAIYMDYI